MVLSPIIRNYYIQYLSTGYSSDNPIRIVKTFSREKNLLGVLPVAYLAVRLANAVIPTWKKPVSVE